MTSSDSLPGRDGALTAPTDISGHGPAAAPSDRGTDISGQRGALLKVHDTYRRWFGPGYDLSALDCVLGAAAAEQLDGDPPWMLIVGGSGAAKTETVMPLVGEHGGGATGVSTITGEGALLSATSAKERSKKATGGLLRQIGPRGILVIKDVTSIISMNRDSRALVLAALREIYDGHWTRTVGTDGGRTLHWSGRLVLIGAVTTAWDAAHSVVSAMGDRFLLVRFNSEARQQASRQAMRNVDHEAQMRAELAAAVKALLASAAKASPIDLTDAELDELFRAADLVTRARTAVERDYQGSPMHAHALEMPTRFAKQLVQVMRGAVSVGMTRDAAMGAALRCAGDSVPPLRYAVLQDVAAHPATRTSDVAGRVQMPRKTVDRALQELQLLGLLTVQSIEAGPNGGTRWVYSLVSDDEGLAEKALASMRDEKAAREEAHRETLRVARNVSTRTPERGQECQDTPEGAA